MVYNFINLYGSVYPPALITYQHTDKIAQNVICRLFIISRMPKLKFLDAKVIERSEWSLIHSDVSIVEEVPSHADVELAMERVSLWKRIFGGKEAQSNVNRNAYYLGKKN